MVYSFHQNTCHSFKNIFINYRGFMRHIYGGEPEYISGMGNKATV